MAAIHHNIWGENFGLHHLGSHVYALLPWGNNLHNILHVRGPHSWVWVYNK